LNKQPGARFHHDLLYENNCTNMYRNASNKRPGAYLIFEDPGLFEGALI